MFVLLPLLLQVVYEAALQLYTLYLLDSQELQLVPLMRRSQTAPYTWLAAVLMIAIKLLYGLGSTAGQLPLVAKAPGPPGGWQHWGQQVLDQLPGISSLPLTEEEVGNTYSILSLSPSFFSFAFTLYAYCTSLQFQCILSCCFGWPYVSGGAASSVAQPLLFPLWPSLAKVVRLENGMCWARLSDYFPTLCRFMSTWIQFSSLKILLLFWALQLWVLLAAWQGWLDSCTHGCPCQASAVQSC